MLITTFNIWRGGFIAELLDRVEHQLEAHPELEARMMVNICSPRSSTSLAQLRAEALDVVAQPVEHQSH